jgi:hypothetical protein
MIRSLDVRRGAPPDPLLDDPKAKAKPAAWLLDIAPQRRVSLHMLQLLPRLPLQQTLALVTALTILRRGL